MFDISYSQELDNSDNFCEDESHHFLNISFDSNISIEHIKSKSDEHVSIETPPKMQAIRESIDPQKSAQSSTTIDKLNISFDSNDSISLFEENCVQNPGKFILFNSTPCMGYKNVMIFS